MSAKFLPLAGVALFLGVGFIWRPWLHYRRYGNSGIILFRSPGWRQKLRDGLFVLLMALMSVQAAVFAFSTDSTPYGLLWPTSVVASGLGATLVVAGVALMAAAQLQLGSSWRIGVDEQARPGLVTRGLYRFSRNPIFLGMFISLGGMAVLTPTWLSFAAFLGAIYGVRCQVLEEEAYLLHSYSEEYRVFKQSVGRFLPHLGRWTTARWRNEPLGLSAYQI